MKNEVRWELKELLPTPRSVMAVTTCEGEPLTRIPVLFAGHLEKVEYCADHTECRPDPEDVMSEEVMVKWLVADDWNSHHSHAYLGDLMLAEDRYGFLGYEFDGVEQDWTKERQACEKGLREEAAWSKIWQSVKASPTARRALQDAMVQFKDDQITVHIWDIPQYQRPDILAVRDQLTTAAQKIAPGVQQVVLDLA